MVFDQENVNDLFIKQGRFMSFFQKIASADFGSH